MAKQAQKAQRQILSVKSGANSDGIPMPYCIDANEEEYPITVLRYKEVAPGKWRYTVQVDKREMYLFRIADEWWAE